MILLPQVFTEELLVLCPDLSQECLYLRFLLFEYPLVFLYLVSKYRINNLAPSSSNDMGSLIVVPIPNPDTL